MSNTDDTTLERQQNMAPAAGQDGMELREIVALLWNGKWWITGFIFAGLVLSLAYAFLATPVYRADAMLQIQQRNSSLSALGGQSDILSSLFGANSQAQAEIQIMTSRAVIDPVIRKMNLDVSVKGAPYGAVDVSHLKVPPSWYDRKLTLRSQGGGAYALYGPDGRKLLSGQVGKTVRADAGKISINIATLKLAKGATAKLSRHPMQETFSGISRRLNAVEMGHDTGIVQMSLLGPHPAHVRNVLNALVEQYLDQNVSAFSAQARRSLQFVNKQLPNLKKQMNAAEDKLTSYQVSHNTVNINEQAKALLQEFNTLEGELTQLQLAEAALGQQYTSKYPAYAAMEQQKSNVQKRIKTLEDRIDSLPKDEQGYVRLKRDAEVYTKLYTTLLDKEQDLRVAAAGTVGSARVVDDAVTPIRPVKPNKHFVVILGFFLGLGFGVAAIFLRNALSRGMNDPIAIEQRFGVPMYAVVPHSRAEVKMNKRRKVGSSSIHSLLALDDDQDPTIEAIRSLRTSLNIALRYADDNVVGLTGPVPGIGKSFIAANIAYLAATTGRKVLLIDADLRRGHLHRYLGQPAASGLAEMLSGEASYDDSVRRHLLQLPFDFISSGKYPKNPSELLMKCDFGGILKDLEKRYDQVFIDMPPILNVVDPMVMMPHISVNVVILRAALHTERQIELALSRIRQNGVSVSGFVLNDLSRAEDVYAYGAYKYH